MPQEFNIRSILGQYTEHTLGELKVRRDPNNLDLVAVRAHIAPKGAQEWIQQDFLIDLSSGDMEEILASIEEVEFTSWPPTSGSPRLF